MNLSLKRLLTVTVLLLIIGAGIVLFIVDGGKLNPFDYVLIGLIAIVGSFALQRRTKLYIETKQGFPEDDELSLRIKHKAGYYAFQSSMYVWLFIFLFRNKIASSEIAIGGGILLTAALSFVYEIILKRQLNEESH